MRALLLLLLPVLSLQAASFPPPLSPERPVSEAVAHVAAGDQHTPAVASNGEIALVAWTDRRNRFEDRVFATRVDASGNVLDTDGIVLSSEPFPALGGIVWNGTHFAVAIRQIAVWTLVFVAPDGTIAGKRTLDVPGEWADATEGGTGVRMLFMTSGAHPSASIVDGDGDVVVRGLALTGGDEEAQMLIAGSRGQEFLVMLRTRRLPDPALQHRLLPHRRRGGAHHVGQRLRAQPRPRGALESGVGARRGSVGLAARGAGPGAQASPGAEAR